MATLDYLDKNRGFITSTKLKTFWNCPMKYYLQYVLELPEQEEGDDEKRHFVLGRAFDEFMALAELHPIPLAWSFWESKWAIMEKYKKRERENDLTGSEGKMLKAAVDDALRQPLFEVGTGYETKKVLFAEYHAQNGEVLKLKGELDRFYLEKRMIRDYKFHRDISKFEWDMEEGPSYLVQGSFYEILALMNFPGDIFQFIFDVSGKNNGDVMSNSFEVSEYKIATTITRIQEQLELLAECQRTNTFPAVPPNMRLQRCIKEKCPMYRHCKATAIQNEFTIL